jgi:hypothetical protein
VEKKKDWSWYDFSRSERPEKEELKEPELNFYFQLNSDFSQEKKIMIKYQLLKTGESSEPAPITEAHWFVPSR